VIYSPATWYRDYAASCGVSGEGKKSCALVAQRNRQASRKKALTAAIADDAAPDPACPAPVWQRSPMRVSFEPHGEPKQTLAIRGHMAGIISEEEDEE